MDDGYCLLLLLLLLLLIKHNAYSGIACRTPARCWKNSHCTLSGSQGLQPLLLLAPHGLVMYFSATLAASTGVCCCC
jgi:hypothetical protein